jgi:hypothetical protein
MENSKIDLEVKVIMGLIVFGLLVTLVVEVFQLNLRPIVLLIFLGVSITALFYKFLGGMGNSMFSTPVFKLTGSAAFLFAFIYFINPILEKQSKPSIDEITLPHYEKWMAVDKGTLQPIRLGFPKFDYELAENKLPGNLDLDFVITDNRFNVFVKGHENNFLGSLNTDKVTKAFEGQIEMVLEQSQVFMTGRALQSRTTALSWFPYQIMPVLFDDETTYYQIMDGDQTIVSSEIYQRGSNLHNINGKNFLLTIHRVDHSNQPYMVWFTISELGANVDVVSK